MDINCRQSIVSENYHDYIVSYSLSLYNLMRESDENCVNNVDNKLLLIYTPDDEAVSISRSGYNRIPKLFTLMDTTSMDASGITRLQDTSGLALRGQGCLVGIIDTGIDYLNPIFTYGRNLSKINALWDQSISSDTDNIYQYGTIYSSEQINQALAAHSRGEDPYSIVASRDDIGHGTFLAGIAAGRADTVNDFIGAAPDAELLIVKLKPAKQYLRDFYFINDEAVAYQENDIIMALKFMHDKAQQLGRPLAVCIGLGTNSGPHTSGTPLAGYINSLSGMSGNAIVCCMGNEGNARHHFAGMKLNTSDYESVEISVGENEKGFTLELWSDLPELFSVSVISPTGETIPRIPARNTSDTLKVSFLLEKTIIYIDYRLVESQSGNEAIIMRFSQPTAGIWRINVYGLSGITGIYNMWLPVTQFLTSDVHFLRSSPETTLTSPAGAYDAISAGAYDHINNSLFIESGRGPTADGKMKPDIVAPGVNVYGPWLNQTYTRLSGTSIAAAHTAGAVAVIYSWLIQTAPNSRISGINIRSLLIYGASRSNIRSYPNPEWGYGTLDLFNLLEQLRVQ